MLLSTASFSICAQGVTTSSLRGTITDDTGSGLPGANISAIHVPTGTFYGAATDDDGFYRIDNMRVGGPYTITASFVGFDDKVIQNVSLRLGEPFLANIAMGESSLQLDEVVVLGQAGSIGQNSGSSTQISSEVIENLPTISRDIDDYLRLTPQSSGFGGGTSFAGTNNRFNAIYVDGAVNNDVFGLASSGTNGGQTGISPFSIDIIDQFQVVLSPYDVTLGGFAGGGVNAVTKSGTNRFEGTAYYFYQDQSLVGRTNSNITDRTGNEATRLADFTTQTYGASLGGPLVKDKVFFFTNVEIQDDIIPAPFDPALYTAADGRASESDLNNLRDFLINTYDYDPGTFGNTEDELQGLKFFGKLDFNLNNNNKLTLRHQFTRAEQFNRNSGNSSRINFSNNGIFFPSTTNSSALELNSRFGNSASNNLIIGFTDVNDDRGSLGRDFPFVVIDDGSGGSIRFGTQEFSTGNVLEQQIFTLTNNFKLYKGNHTFTIGTHNEFYSIRNVFIRQNFGSYDFDNLEIFLNGGEATDFDRSYSLIPGDENVLGDDSQAAADFGAFQLGFYAQDEIEVTNKLKITAGLRLDIPVLSSDPAIDPSFATSTLPLLQQQYEVANRVSPGQAPDGQLMWSPRLGFEYKFDKSRLLFIADPANQYVDPTFATPSGQLDLFVEDFRYPQVLRGNLAYDLATKDGWNFSFEGLYTKTLNNVLYTSVNSSTEVDFTWTGSPDNRPVFVGESIDPTYFAIYVGSNTSQGYTYNLTASASKSFTNGLSVYGAYSFSDAEAVNEGTSSQNSSQWRGQINTNGRNNPLLGRSDFSVGSRFIGTLSYQFDWGGNSNLSTSVSLLYEGQSGRAFSYVYDRGAADSRNINNERGSTSRNRSLIFVPASFEQSNLIDFVNSSGQTISAQQQWENLNALIESDSHLSSRRGQYSEKNGSRQPWQNQWDLSIRQDVGTNVGGRNHKLQFSVDIFNFANLLNSSWGTRYFVQGDFNNNELILFEGYADDGTTPQFTYRDDQLGTDRLDIADFSSRWNMRLGLRYIFD